jgi:cell wall-associated NlpC family hydrolase
MSKVVKLLVSSAVFVLLLGLFTGFSFAQSAKIGIITGNGVNIRATGNTSSKILTQVPKGAKVTVYSSTGGWCKVSYGKQTGWVYAKYVSVSSTSLGTGTITGSGVNLRSSGSTTAKILKTLDKGNRVTVVSKSSGWYKVKTSSGTIGWIMSSYVSLSTSTSSVSRGSDVSSSSSESSLRERMVTFAKKYLGVNYVYGGGSPSGFDCSGFTQYVYSNFGIRLNRTAADQATQGERVNKADLRPGDLIFFDTNGGHDYINHAAMYIGGGNFIHASSGRGEVTITSLSESFYVSAYMTSRRFIN